MLDLEGGVKNSARAKGGRGGGRKNLKIERQKKRRAAWISERKVSFAHATEPEMQEETTVSEKVRRVLESAFEKTMV
jgi:hypothetical protein